MISSGYNIWALYASLKENEQNGRVPTKVLPTHPHYLEARITKIGVVTKGQAVRPEYEDFRLAPSSTFAMGLVETEVRTWGVGGYDTDRHLPVCNALIISH